LEKSKGVELNDFERLAWLTNLEQALVSRKTADDGITKSKQLKCIFDVHFHIICIQISFKM
jgi:gluconate kinase